MSAQPKTVLIAEDSPLQATMLRRGLENAGYVVLEARDGEQALDLALRAPPAAVVSDIRMPRLDGYELCRAIRRTDALADIPVILLTELSDPLDVIRGLEAGADAYLTKPYDYPTLVARIESLTAFPVHPGASGERDRTKVCVSGDTFEITAHGPRILNLLISTYENAVLQNQQLVAAQQALEYLNTNLEQRVLEKTERVRRLNRVHAVRSDINAAIARIRDRRELFQEACRIAVEVGGFALAWIGSVDGTRGSLQPEAWAGEAAREYLDVLEPALTARGGGIEQLFPAVLTGAPAVSNDVASEAELPLQDEYARRGIQSLVTVPLLQGGQVVALLALYATESGFFDADEMVLLRDLAADLAFALEYMAKAETVNYLAYYDVLTGLPNRALLLDRVAQHLPDAGAQQRGAALLMLNIQRFHNINDTLGRSAGDEILRTIAARLRASIGVEATPARVDADLFALLAKDIAGERDAMQLARATLKACFSEPFFVEGSELRLAGRIGIALFPSDALDADGLYRKAETGLTRASQTGEECLFYSPEMSARIAEQLDLETRLRRAIESQQFALHYQPRFSSLTGELLSVEALIRWNDPQNGLVLPGHFIPLLEETGLIVPVGEWALREAVRQHAAWKQAGLKAPRIGVNVSALQLHRPDFIPLLRDIVSGAPAGNPGIELELTETLVMSHVEENIEKLTAVREMGIQVLVDDFGTGYSSLRYLATLPIDGLKVDRSFIINLAQNPNDVTIVSSMISLAHDLKLTVVGEGVDSDEQAKLLRLLKCDEMQGFLFAKPMPAEEIASRLGSSQEVARVA